MNHLIKRLPVGLPHLSAAARKWFADRSKARHLFIAESLEERRLLSANLLVNGDFENEPNFADSVSGYGVNGNDPGFSLLVGSQIPGWTIVPGHGVTVHNTREYPVLGGSFGVNTDGEGYNGVNADFYQDIATTNGSAYTLAFDYKGWENTSSAVLNVSVTDTVTNASLFNGLYTYDSNLNHIVANFHGAGNPVRLEVRENPESGTNDDQYNVDNFSITSESSTLKVLTQPANAGPGNSISPPIQVAFEDASGNVDPNTNDLITATIASSSTGAGMLGGSTVVQSVDGIATFSGLTIDKSGKYSLTFTGSANDTVDSNSFQIGVAVINQISTTDSKQLTVQYSIAANGLGANVALNVYRSANATYAVGGIGAVSIANLTLIGADAMVGDHTITISPPGTAGATYTFSQANAFRPDPTHKYVIATIDEDGTLSPDDVQVVPQSSFRIWLVGAVTHGYVGDGYGPLNSELPTDYPGDYQAFVSEFAANLENNDGYDRAIAFHWETAADLALPDQPTIQGAKLESDILFDVKTLPLDTNDVVDLNCIGWSRGGIVVNSALTVLSNDAFAPKQLQHGFICESLVDPHPANNTISSASTYLPSLAGISYTEFAKTAILYDGYVKFQDAAHDLQDVGFVIPPNVYAVSDMYQHNLAATMSGSEYELNLWGLSPSQITPNANTSIINNQVTTPGIGHTEIMVDVERQIIQNNVTLEELNLYPFGYPFPTPASNSVVKAPGVSGATPAALSRPDVETRASAMITPLVAGTPAQLVVATQPPSIVTGNSAFGLTVTVEDSTGNVATSFNGPVTVALGQNLLDASLDGTLTVDASAGVATFSGLSIYQPGTYTLTATATSLTAGTSSLFTVTTPPATQLVIEPLSTNVLTNGAFSLAVDAEDSFGTVDVNFNGPVSIALSSSDGGSLGGTLTATAVNGVATFSGLTINKAGTDEIAASASGLSGGASHWFTVTNDQLIFTTAPQNSTLGRSFGLIVSAENAAGIDPAFTGLITLSPSEAPDGSQPTLGGTFARPAVNGTATFFGLTLPQGVYIVQASADGVASAQSPGFAVTGGLATHLAVTNQPGSPVTVGAAFEVDVTTEDGQGAVDTSFNGPVTLAVSAGPGTLAGTTTVNAVDGVATFSGMTLSVADPGYTLTAQGDGFSATTATINITPAATATSLLFTASPPAGVTAGAAFGVTVAAVDSFGTVDTSFTGPITLSANLDGTATTALGGTLTVNAVAGVATFTGLTIDTAGSNQTLSATATGLASIPSATFGVIAGVATQLVIGSPESNIAPGSPFALVVHAEDAFGNTDSTFNQPLTLALVSTPGQTLGGTVTATAVNGIAAFASLTLAEAGSANTLQATGGSLTGSISVAVNPDQLVVTTSPPSLVAVNGAFALTVSAVSAAGTIDANFNGAVTVSLVDVNSTGATLAGTLTVNAVVGVATFSGLSVNSAGRYELAVASDSGAASAVTPLFTATTAVSPAASTVIPSFGRLKVPATGVAGQRFTASLPLTLSATSTPVSGRFTVNLYADSSQTLDGQQVLLGTFPVSTTLKAGKHKSTTLRLKSLPASLPAGTYHLLAEVVDPTSATALAVSSQTVKVAAPLVTLSATATADPHSVKHGKPVRVTLVIVNSGNIVALGNMAISLQASSDGTASGVTSILANLSHAVHITPGRPFHLSLHIKAPTASFYPYVSLTLGAASTTAVGPLVSVT